jgi:ADP-ribose pyrophosphatase YjhB (NUDIX family)
MPDQHSVAGSQLDAERFCSRCGAAMDRKMEGGRERPYCAACGRFRYGRFSVGVGGLLIHEGKVLLVQRAKEPGKGRWTLPGGYTEEDESPDIAVAREVLEETGLEVVAGPLLAIRHAQTAENQNAYYVFRVSLAGPPDRLRAEGDGEEVARAVFAAPSEIDALGHVGMISRWAVERYSCGGDGLCVVPPGKLPSPVPTHAWTVVYGASAST